MVRIGEDSGSWFMADYIIEKLIGTVNGWWKMTSSEWITRWGW